MLLIGKYTNSFYFILWEYKVFFGSWEDIENYNLRSLSHQQKSSQQRNNLTIVLKKVNLEQLMQEHLHYEVFNCNQNQQLEVISIFMYAVVAG